MMHGKLKTICAALMTGVTVGTVAGVLYAPQSGSRTRRDLRRRAGRKLDEIGEMKDNVRDYTSEVLSGIKENTNACIANTRQTIIATGEAVVEAMDGIRSTVENNMRRLERSVREFRS